MGPALMTDNTETGLCGHYPVLLLCWQDREKLQRQKLAALLLWQQYFRFQLFDKQI
jgi:hypothetical protein